MSDNNNSFNWGGAIGGLGGGLLGMIGQNKRAEKQHKRQKELMGIQFANQQALNKQGQKLQMQSWRDTGYGAQMDMMKEAGLNPGLMYGMSGGGGQTTGSQGGGSAQSGNSHAPMDIGASVQAGLMMAQAKKLNAETDEIKKKTEESDSRIAVNQQEADKKAQEIINIGLQNKEAESTIDNKIRLVAVELANAKLDGIQTTEETKGIIEKVKQDWEKLMQSGQEVNIKEFEANIKAEYPSLWNVGGKVGKDIWETLENVELWLRNKTGEYINRPKMKQYKRN